MSFLRSKPITAKSPTPQTPPDPNQARTRSTATRRADRSSSEAARPRDQIWRACQSSQGKRTGTGGSTGAGHSPGDGGAGSATRGRGARSDLAVGSPNLETVDLRGGGRKGFGLCA
jgi:hypothetical protein